MHQRTVMVALRNDHRLDQYLRFWIHGIADRFPDLCLSFLAFMAL